MKTATVSTLVVLLLGALAFAQITPPTITFDNYPAGTKIWRQYIPNGVVFRCTFCLNFFSYTVPKESGGYELRSDSYYPEEPWGWGANLYLEFYRDRYTKTTASRVEFDVRLPRTTFDDRIENGFPVVHYLIVGAAALNPDTGQWYTPGVYQLLPGDSIHAVFTNSRIDFVSISDTRNQSFLIDNVRVTLN